MTIFTEALTHGSVSWKAEHERRTLLFRYSPRRQQHSAEPPKPPKSVDLTPSQRLLFEPTGPRPVPK